MRNEKMRALDEHHEDGLVTHEIRLVYSSVCAIRVCLELSFKQAFPADTSV